MFIFYEDILPNYVRNWGLNCCVWLRWGGGQLLLGVIGSLGEVNWGSLCILASIDQYSTDTVGRASVNTTTWIQIQYM